MNLKPMSLNQKEKEQQQQDTIENSNELECYIIPDDVDDNPVLHIVDASKSTMCSMRLFRNRYVHCFLTNMQDYSTISGQSTDTFSKVMGRIDNYNDSNSILTRDLLIYGFICEAFSKAGLPHKMILQHIDIITKFIQESLCYYEYRTCSIEFNLSKLLPFIQVKKEEYDTCAIMKRFILPGEVTPNGLLCKGLIAVSERSAYIRSSLHDVYKIDCPKFLAPISDHRILSDAVNSLLWILLEHLGFYGNEVFANQNEDM